MKRLNRLRLVVHLIALIAVTGGAGVRIVNAQVEDTAAPALTEFDFNPKTIDVSAGPQTVTVTVRITDDLSGFEFGNFIFLSPSGQQDQLRGLQRSEPRLWKLTRRRLPGFDRHSAIQ